MIIIKRITFFDISPPLHIDVPIHNLSCYKPAFKYYNINHNITMLFSVERPELQGNRKVETEPKKRM